MKPMATNFCLPQRKKRVRHRYCDKQFVAPEDQRTVHRWTRWLMNNNVVLSESIFRHSNNNKNVIGNSTTTYTCTDHQAHLIELLNRHTVPRIVSMTQACPDSPTSGHMVVGKSNVCSKILPRCVATMNGECHTLPRHPGFESRQGYKSSGGAVINKELSDMVCGGAEVRPSSEFLLCMLRREEIVKIKGTDGTDVRNFNLLCPILFLLLTDL